MKFQLIYNIEYSEEDVNKIYGKDSNVSKFYIDLLRGKSNSELNISDVDRDGYLRILADRSIRNGSSIITTEQTYFSEGELVKQ
jgi:hypothetical protein